MVSDSNTPDNPDIDVDEVEAPETTTGDASESAPEAGDESVDLVAEVERLQAELADANDRSLRTQAEMQNLRRRVERDVEQAHKFGIEKFVNAMIPVLDNLDRAVAAANPDDEAVKALLDGVELTRKSAVDAFKSLNVEPLEPVGEPFDPQMHQAMSMVPSPTAEPNSVIDVLQKGYTLNGRLIRAAMVVVAKAPE